MRTLAIVLFLGLYGTPAWAETGASSKGRSVKITEYVARLRDDLECFKIIEGTAQKSVNTAWAIMVACIRQDKFRNLKTLFSPPWKNKLKKLPKLRQVQLATHILATAGIWRDRDLLLLRENGLQVGVPEDVRDLQGARYRGYVLFRGRITNRTLLRDGRMKLYIAEMTRMARTGTRDVWEDSGYDLEASVGDLPLIVRKGNEYVFLARAKSSTNVTTVVDILDVFTPGIALEGLDITYR